MFRWKDLVYKNTFLTFRRVKSLPQVQVFIFNYLHQISKATKHLLDLVQFIFFWKILSLNASNFNNNDIRTHSRNVSVKEFLLFFILFDFLTIYFIHNGRQICYPYSLSLYIMIHQDNYMVFYLIIIVKYCLI